MRSAVGLGLDSAGPMGRLVRMGLFTQGCTLGYFPGLPTGGSALRDWFTEPSVQILRISPLCNAWTH
jgi:hypothetical protein